MFAQPIMNLRDPLSKLPFLDGCITFLAQLPHASRANVSGNLLPASSNVSCCYCICLTHKYRAHYRLHINYNVSRNLPPTSSSSVTCKLLRMSSSNGSRNLVRASNSIVSRILPVRSSVKNAESVNRSPTLDPGNLCRCSPGGDLPLV
jgi:hypothetical protein